MKKEGTRVDEKEARISKILTLSSLSASNFRGVTASSLSLRGDAPILGDCTLMSVVILQNAFVRNAASVPGGPSAAIGFVFRDLRDRCDRVAARVIGSASLQLAQ